MNVIEANKVNQMATKTNIDALAQFISKGGEQVLINLPDFKVSEGHALLMARKLIEQLRKSELKAKRKFNGMMTDMMSRRMGRKAYNNIRSMMLSQLGAFELNKANRRESIVYYLEVGEEGDDTVYLCSSICSRKNPYQSWSSAKHAALTRHALERAFLRGCIWVKGQIVRLRHIVKELFDIHFSHVAYNNEYCNQAMRLVEKGWSLSFSDITTQYIVRHDEKNLPTVMTVYKADDETPEGGIAKMIPPEGCFGNPKLLANLNQLGQQFGLLKSA